MGKILCDEERFFVTSLLRMTRWFVLQQTQCRNLIYDYFLIFTKFY